VTHLICRDGEIVAIAGTTRFFLAPDIERRDRGDAERRIAVLMCEYARRVGAGIFPGPYDDELAESWARFVLQLIDTEPALI
jgi:sugar phosphate isomerase/epimerase